MRQFFKIFIATLLAVMVFAVIVVLVVAGWIGSIASSDKPEVGSRGILYIDLQQAMSEQTVDNPLASLGVDDHYNVPGLYDMMRLIRYAKTDSSIKGIYLRCNDNGNGLASSESCAMPCWILKTVKSLYMPTAMLFRSGPIMWPMWPTAFIVTRKAG